MAENNTEQHRETNARYESGNPGFRVERQNVENNNIVKPAFYYDPNINYSEYRYIQIGKMDKICNKCKAKKWSDEPDG